MLLQWNLFKADTIGAKKNVLFIEMSTLQRFFLRKFDRKAKQSVLAIMSVLWMYPLYRDSTV